MIKNEKGSVTLIVAVTILFIIIVLSSSLMLVSIKRKSQLQETKILQEIYGGDNLDEIYQEQVEKLSHSNSDTSFISASDVTPSLYGRYVDYDIDLNENGVTDDWKILYADEFNIYLIAADYLNTKFCPTKDGVAITNNVNSYTTSFSTDLLDKYAGSADITSPKIKNLNSDFFNTKKYSSEDYNMKAVAYMLDTDIWTKQLTKTDDTYVDYVIGGPTIELFFNAYNAKYGTNFGAKAYSENSTYGYKISSDKSKNESSTTDWLYNIGKLLSSSDSTFAISDTPKSPAMFMASTSAHDNANLMFVYYDGSVSYCGYDNHSVGFRPVICLKNETGITWDSEKELFKLVSLPQTSPTNHIE